MVMCFALVQYALPVDFIVEHLFSIHERMLRSGPEDVFHAANDTQPVMPTSDAVARDKTSVQC